MMDGRVKTLHPMVHGGLLSLRDDAGHQASMDEHGIEAIDLLVVNLYPFEATVAAGAGYDDCIENIDIGGPAMIRAASKNHAFVTVVVDAEDYSAVLAEMDAGRADIPRVPPAQAQIAYARTAAYDAAVSRGWRARLERPPPRRRAVAGTLAADAAIRRKRAPVSGVLHRRHRPPRCVHRNAASGQRAVVQQHQRH